ncbi:MAG: cytidylate kinase-like family protein [Muribaculaceae bacterium]|nr:cytidylate kinase-like family protein [Muribaculaceae bacterium]MBQ4005679.1 cytidylate kinase-like family protein [Muribaculaceae bacterium]
MDTEGQKQQHYVITIGRQFGCGGREIGRAVAQLLGIGYYDKELLVELAAKSGCDAAYFEAADERRPSFLGNLWSFNVGGYSSANLVGNVGANSIDDIYHAQSQVMRDIADRGSCVIVGRTADYILRDHCTVLSVFVHSTLADRVARIIARGDSDNENAAAQLANKKNQLRADYYNFYTDKRWGEAASYDLSIDSTVLGIEGTAAVIAEWARRSLSARCR